MQGKFSSESLDLQWITRENKGEKGHMVWNKPTGFTSVPKHWDYIDM